MGDSRTQQDRLRDKHGTGSDPSRDATKQGAPGSPKRFTEAAVSS